MIWLALSLFVHPGVAGAPAPAAPAATPVPAGAVVVTIAASGGISVGGGAALACPPDWCGNTFPALESTLSDAFTAAPAAPLSMVVAPGARFDAVSSVIRAARALGFSRIWWTAEGEPSGWELPPEPEGGLIRAVGTVGGTLPSTAPPPPLTVQIGRAGTAASRYRLDDKRQPNRPGGEVDLDWLGAQAAADRKAFPTEASVFVDADGALPAAAVRPALQVLQREGYATMNVYARRDTPKAPPQALTLGKDPIVLGALDTADIAKVIQPKLAKVEACYVKARKARPELAGKVVLKFVISARGTVDSTAIKSTTLGDAAVEECLAKTIGALKFPAPRGGGIVIVSWPFTFSAVSDSGQTPP